MTSIRPSRRALLGGLAAAAALCVPGFAAAQAGAGADAPGTAATSPGETDRDAAGDPDGFIFVRLDTSEGDVDLLLDAKAAPFTVKNFLEYVDDGFYAGTVFHRVIPNFMIQGGGFTVEGDQKETRDGVWNEWRNGLKNVQGSLAMARTNLPHSGTAQFYVNVVDNPGLDRPQAGNGAAYAVFGTVVDGMDAVEAIRTTETGRGTLSGRPAGDVPTTFPVIESATRIEADDLSDAAKAATEAWRSRYADARARVQDRRARHAAAMKTLEEKGTDTQSGLRYAIGTEGPADAPVTAVTDTVVVEYTGWLPEGLMFDSSLESPRGPSIEFPLNGVIAGFREGLTGMKVGETRYLRIPPDLGYGQRPIEGQPNATLVFEVKLVGIKAADEDG